MPPPQVVVVFDTTPPKLIDGRRETRWFLAPLRTFGLLAVAALVFAATSALHWPLTAGAWSVAAGDRSAAENAADATLYFLSADAELGGEKISELGPLREGYATLWWSRSTTATAYRLTDSAGETVYVGHLAHAFVSGLPDGYHRFDVVGIGPSGDVVASTTSPLVVYVQHWDRWVAWTLFAIGAVVVALLLIVLLVGSLATADDSFSDHAASNDDAGAASRILSATGRGAANAAVEEGTS